MAISEPPTGIKTDVVRRQMQSAVDTSQDPYFPKICMKVEIAVYWYLQKKKKYLDQMNHSIFEEYHIHVTSSNKFIILFHVKHQFPIQEIIAWYLKNKISVYK